MKKQTKVYWIAIALPLLVGALSALLTRNSMDLYESIIRPPASPPSWLFPVVWTVLYVLMGIGSARVYLKEEKLTLPLKIYLVQLFVNFLWSLLFFNARVFLIAFLWLLLLIALVIAMIRTFAAVDSLAAKLQWPYLLWTVFAAYLNVTIYLLNR